MFGDSFTNIRMVTYSNTVQPASLDDMAAITLQFPIDDNLVAGTALGSVVGAATWGLENVANIPEIDLIINSVSVTAKSKKLKVKWTPELGQDLNAYHNLDAEVELTRNYV